MSAVVVLEWNFLPPDYFEERIEISRHDYTMIIADGNVQAKIDSPVYESDPSMRQRLHDALNDRFLGVQLLSHRAYQLSKPTMTRVHPDGRKDYFMEAEPGRYNYSGSPVDFQSRTDTETSSRIRGRTESRGRRVWQNWWLGTALPTVPLPRFLEATTQQYAMRITNWCISMRSAMLCPCGSVVNPLRERH
jgi:hypothetical protein